jgi:hypothetical protein
MQRAQVVDPKAHRNPVLACQLAGKAPADTDIA